MMRGFCAMWLALVVLPVAASQGVQNTAWNGYYLGVNVGEQFSSNDWVTSLACPNSSICAGGQVGPDFKQTSTARRCASVRSADTTGCWDRVSSPASKPRSAGRTTATPTVRSRGPRRAAAPPSRRDQQRRHGRGQSPVGCEPARAGRQPDPARHAPVRDRRRGAAAGRDGRDLPQRRHQRDLLHPAAWRVALQFPDPLDARLDHRRRARAHAGRQLATALEYRYADFGQANPTFFANNLGDNGDDRVFAHVWVKTHTVSLGAAYKF